MEGVGGGGAGTIVFGGEWRVLVSSLRLSICVRIFVFILISLTVLFVCIVLLGFYHYFQLEYWTYAKNSRQVEPITPDLQLVVEC